MLYYCVYTLLSFLDRIPNWLNWSNFSNDRIPNWLYFHWSARRSSDASCPASCPACLDISQGLKARPPVCKASVIPTELASVQEGRFLFALCKSSLEAGFFGSSWPLRLSEPRFLLTALLFLHHWSGSFSAVSAFLHNFVSVYLFQLLFPTTVFI